ncbi:hypothetical protein AGMMS49579_13500 [Spirochaetia bacterium]|nr:hypothetical protein AGMMS49579_13500 [Spirochaetia bacterium]
MIKEFGWYLGDNRFGDMVTEIQGSIEAYAAAKQAGTGEETLSPLREAARNLFEGHSVRSGLREEHLSYINIDAEFFNGNTLNQAALDTFMKEVMKGHCYQKVLWTYMGTTGSFTQISKVEMAQQGLRYEDYLPIEYRKMNPAKKPLEGKVGDNTIPLYVYNDGSVSQNYIREKAQLRFDTLADRSGIDWQAGYDPNGSVKKEGWHGEYDADGNWRRVDEGEHGANNAADTRAGQVQSMEIIKNGDTAVLYDPGMILFSPDMIWYFTEAGEEYGSLMADQKETIEEIRKALGRMGVTGIGAIGGIKKAGPEIIETYQAVLKDLAVPGLQMLDAKTVKAIRGEQQRMAQVALAEGTAVELERTISIVSPLGGDREAVQRALVDGTVSVPLIPGNLKDAPVFGLSEAEAAALNQEGVSPEKAGAYNGILSNVYASWPEYAGSGISRLVMAKMARDYVEGKGDPEAVVNGETSLGAIAAGPQELNREGVSRYASGIPGVFSEPAVIDFYDEAAKVKYLETLEKKHILPKGGKAAALAALAALPEGSPEQKGAVNRGLTRALGQYKAISMSTGMPIGELIKAVTEGAEGKSPAALNRKVYYELPLDTVFKNAAEENRQRREVTVASLAAEDTPALIIGGVGGAALSTVGFDRKTLEEVYGYEGREAEQAETFMQGLRMGEGANEATLGAMLAEITVAVKKNRGGGFSAMRGDVLGRLDEQGHVGYNLASKTGFEAYTESGRFKRSNLRKGELEAVLAGKLPAEQAGAVPGIASIMPRYRSNAGTMVPLKRVAPQGLPERIRKAASIHESYAGSNGAAVDIPAGLVGINYRSYQDSKEQTVPFTAGRKLPPGGLKAGNQRGAGGYNNSPGNIPSSDMSLRPGADNSLGNGNAAVIFNPPDGGSIRAESEIGSLPAVPMGNVPPRRHERDAELERLRRIEANYEKDKAMLAKEKVPALARSDSHEVGHAEGMEEDMEPQKATMVISNDLVDELRQRAGV